MKKWVVVYGNFRDGFRVTGPFDEREAAQVEADYFCPNDGDEAAWVVELEDPNLEEGEDE